MTICTKNVIIHSYVLYVSKQEDHSVFSLIVLVYLRGTRSHFSARLVLDIKTKLASQGRF